LVPDRRRVLSRPLQATDCPVGPGYDDRPGPLAGGAGDEGGDDVGGVAVEGHSCSVVAHGGARVGVAGCFLDVAEGYAGVEGGGDEGVAQCVRPDGLWDPGLAGDSSDDARGGVTIESLTVESEEQRTFATLANGEVDSSSGPWCERDDDGLAALAQDRESSMAAFEAECFDVRAGCFGDA